MFNCVLVGLLEQSTAQLVLVNTNQGTVRGSKDFVNAYLLTSNRIIGKPFYKFLGIRYAQAPVGPLRFKVIRFLMCNFHLSFSQAVWACNISQVLTLPK